MRVNPHVATFLHECMRVVPWLNPPLLAMCCSVHMHALAVQRAHSRSACTGITCMHGPLCKHTVPMLQCLHATTPCTHLVERHRHLEALVDAHHGAHAARRWRGEDAPSCTSLVLASCIPMQEGGKCMCHGFQHAMCGSDRPEPTAPVFTINVHDTFECCRYDDRQNLGSAMPGLPDGL